MRGAAAVSPLEYELYRLHVWWFLSLDFVAPFWNDLWVPIGQDIREGIRSQLSLAGVTVFQEQPGRVNHAISRWVSSVTSAEYQSLIALWADHVYGRSSDRTAEFVWGHIIACATGKHQVHCPSWIAELLSAIRHKTSTYETELKTRLQS